MSLVEQLLQAALSATDDRKDAALRILKGETPAIARPVTGPLLMGVGQAAKYLGTSRATVWRAVQAGRLTKVELYRGSYRLRREDVEALAAGRGQPVISSQLAVSSGRTGQPDDSQSQIANNQVRENLESETQSKKSKRGPMPTGSNK